MVANSKDYWLHAVSDGVNYNYVFSLSPIVPNNAAFPTYLWSCCCEFVSTSAAGVINQFLKVDFITSYFGSESAGRLIASGSNGAVYTAQPLTIAAGAPQSLVSPQAYRFIFSLSVRAAGRNFAAVAINAALTAEVCYLSTGGFAGTKVIFETALEGGYIYYKPSDVNAQLRLLGYYDVV